ncbi:Hypothetical protein SMAX5B_021122, partial [Scophthalmus maximus]
VCSVTYSGCYVYVGHPHPSGVFRATEVATFGFMCSHRTAVSHDLTARSETEMFVVTMEEE